MKKCKRAGAILLTLLLTLWLAPIPAASAAEIWGGSLTINIRELDGLVGDDYETWLIDILGKNTFDATLPGVNMVYIEGLSGLPFMAPEMKALASKIGGMLAYLTESDAFGYELDVIAGEYSYGFKGLSFEDNDLASAFSAYLYDLNVPPSGAHGTPVTVEAPGFAAMNA